MISLEQDNFHHLGYAVHSVDETSEKLEKLGWESTDAFEDPNQGIRGMFLFGGGPRIELLENLPDSKTLEHFLRLGNFVFYHMAYITNDIEQSVIQSREAGGKLIRSLMPAVAFNGRRICFFAFSGGMIIEWIEGEKE